MSLIADLSDRNVNVYHEVGFLMGLNKGRKAEQANFILIADASKVTADTAIGFNLRPWQQMRFKSDLELVGQIKRALRAHYSLAS